MNAAKPAKCTICRRPVEPEWRPFCSKRCADVDLGRWLGERYVVSEPATPEDMAGMPSNEDDDSA